MLCLRKKTNDNWIKNAFTNMDKLLTNQMNYEYDTVISSLNLLQETKFDADIAKFILKIADEEMNHATKIRSFIGSNKICSDEAFDDRYLKNLDKILASSSVDSKIDLLLISAIKEARYCERLDLLIENSPDGELISIFNPILADEVNHYSQYIRIAKYTFNLRQVSFRLDELCEIESEIISKLDNKPYIFG